MYKGGLFFCENIHLSYCAMDLMGHYANATEQLCNDEQYFSGYLYKRQDNLISHI